MTQFKEKCGTRAGHSHYFRDCPASFGTVGNYVSMFSTLWISLFSHSPKAKAEWKQQTGKSMASYSKSRWWSRWEVLHQLLQQFGDVRPFLEKTEVGPAIRPKLLSILNDPQASSLLKIELAATIDLGEHLVKSAYRLEGDGPLALECYEIVATLKATIHTGHYPNVQAIARTLATTSTAVGNICIELCPAGYRLL